MGWAERLNPKSDWNLRNAKRIVAKFNKLEEEGKLQEMLNKVKSALQSSPNEESEKQQEK